MRLISASIESPMMLDVVDSAALLRVPKHAPQDEALCSETATLIGISQRLMSVRPMVTCVRHLPAAMLPQTRIPCCYLKYVTTQLSRWPMQRALAAIPYCKSNLCEEDKCCRVQLHHCFLRRTTCVHAFCSSLHTQCAMCACKALNSTPLIPVARIEGPVPLLCCVGCAEMCRADRSIAVPCCLRPWRVA